MRVRVPCDECVCRTAPLATSTQKRGIAAPHAAATTRKRRERGDCHGRASRIHEQRRAVMMTDGAEEDGAVEGFANTTRHRRDAHNTHASVAVVSPIVGAPGQAAAARKGEYRACDIGGVGICAIYLSVSYL